MLTHQMPKLPSYRNQSIDLHTKSADWFLYHGNFGFLVKQVNIWHFYIKSEQSPKRIVAKT